MRTPDTTPNQYLILSGLLDGSSLRPSHLMTRIGWSKNRPQFHYELRRLRERGLIDRIGGPGDWCYHVTTFGREGFLETLDFFVFVAEQSECLNDGRTSVADTARRKKRNGPTASAERRLRELARQPSQKWSVYRDAYLADFASRSTASCAQLATVTLKRFEDYAELSERLLLTLGNSDLQTYVATRRGDICRKGRRRGKPLCDATIQREIGTIKTCLKYGGIVVTP